MKFLNTFFAIALIFFSGKAFSDPILQNYGDNFVKNLTTDWKVTTGSWSYFDTAKCYTTPGAICWGNNPTSPYGQPNFIDPLTKSPSPNIQLDSDEAVVIILRTPPQVKYYSFVQYLFQIHGQSNPVFASLSDAVNHKKLGTTGSTQIGAAPFDQYAALVWTADMNTFNTIKVNLLKSGLPAQAINLYPLPSILPTNPAFKLQYGYGASSDSFSMLMRSALPAVPKNFESYKTEKPFYVLKVSPVKHETPNPAPVLGYSIASTGKIEPAGLQLALAKLVNAIKANYETTYTLQNQKVEYSKILGWDCISGSSPCLGDNYDALYSQDLEKSLVVKSVDDFVVIAGVNHQKTGKATYLNHSVYDMKKVAGIVSVDDSMMTTESALYHSASTNPKDSITYQNLYAYIISYNCTGRKFCLQIPAPTPDNPVGLKPGAAFSVYGRSYLEPTSLVRPLDTEVIQHQVFIATKK